MVLVGNKNIFFDISYASMRIEASHIPQIVI